MLEKTLFILYNERMLNIIVSQSNIVGQFDSPLIGTYGGDYSFAGAFLARAAIDSSVICQNLSPHSQQNGTMLLDIIKSFGARVTRNGHEVNVKCDKLKGCRADISEFTQIAPIVALLGVFASGKTRISGFKECPKLQAVIIENLQALGARCEYNENELWIWQQKSPEHAVLNARDNPFVSLALILISTYTKGDTVIRNVDGLLKRYPDFLQVFESLGGKYKTCTEYSI